MKFVNLSRGDEERALALYHKAIVIDASDSTTLEGGDFDWKEYYVKLKNGGITAVCDTIMDIRGNFTEAIRKIYAWYRRFEYIGQTKITLTTEASHIIDAKRKGKIAVVLATQNIRPIDDDLGLLSIFHRLGVRIIGLTYNKRNLAGDGCAEKKDCGLSEFGAEAIKEMNRLGILVDLSHVGYKTSMDAIEVSKAPVIFSHSCVRSLCSEFRNIPDGLIKALAEKGGVIGLPVWSPFIKKTVGPYTKDNPRPTLQEYLAHIDCLADLVGVDHVGLGLDLSEYWAREDFEKFFKMVPELGPSIKFESKYVQDLEDHSKTVNIARGLVSGGYSDQEIGKVLGGNFLRVFGKVWR